MSIISEIVQLNLFERDESGWKTGLFVGRPFAINYKRCLILTADAWKERAGGIPQGCFLLAYYDNEADKPDAAEAVLLRVIQPAQLPTDQDVISSMVEYYKDDIHTGSTKKSQLDTFTRYEFSFSGLECSVLGSFYLDPEKKIRFGADLENFFSAHHYALYKPYPKILQSIVNYRESGVAGGQGDVRIGRVRYSSSRRFQSREKEEVPVYVYSPDFAGKRTALFGMTRTGKSNTLKRIIQACVEMSDKAPRKLDAKTSEAPEEILKPFTDSSDPKYPIGQIVFDINGEYANPNLQDQGTAIFDIYKDITVRYSTAKKDGFKEMKVNFFKEIENGFDLIRSHPNIAADSTRFVSYFRTVSLEKPLDYDTNVSASTRYDRKVAVYLCCLYRAGFLPPSNFKVAFTAGEKVCAAIGSSINPTKGVSLEDAANWWETLWQQHDEASFFSDYKKEKGRDWADEDLKALLVMLTRKRTSGGEADCAGFRVLNPIREQHTSTIQKPFDEDILELLRAGKIVIVDLSLGDPELQSMFSERICQRIFQDSMRRFTETKPNNFIQFCFEEAHNLFPKKDDKDLSQIYNRIAKEGAKLNLGLIYATQEVSSISSNILKATQNWFISHLNNEDEIKELRKYYDFDDFADGLIKFSQDTDKGFIRMKTYSNPFVIPVQIDRFPPEKKA
jgi:Helicase HerA, central domain